MPALQASFCPPPIRLFSSLAVSPLSEPVEVTEFPSLVRLFVVPAPDGDSFDGLKLFFSPQEPQPHSDVPDSGRPYFPLRESRTGSILSPHFFDYDVAVVRTRSPMSAYAAPLEPRFASCSPTPANKVNTAPVGPSYVFSCTDCPHLLISEEAARLKIRLALNSPVPVNEFQWSPRLARNVPRVPTFFLLETRKFDLLDDKGGAASIGASFRHDKISTSQTLLHWRLNGDGRRGLCSGGALTFHRRIVFFLILCALHLYGDRRCRHCSGSN